jgi:RNA-directed DNA polymerase
VVRYADDEVVFCKSKEDAQRAQEELSVWLAERGLTLSREKTRIVHLTEGFDFLGFNVRHYPCPQTTRSGYKLLIRPSKKSVKAVRQKLRQAWLGLKGHSIHAVLYRLNPVLRGWANYFRTMVSSRTFHKLDHWMYHRAVRYVQRTHPTKSKEWRRKRYGGRLNPDSKDRWVFGNTRPNKKTGRYHYLLRFS